MRGRRRDIGLIDLELLEPMLRNDGKRRHIRRDDDYGVDAGRLLLDMN